MKYELVIFDLDGTLLNTLEDLAAATNHALRRFGFPERTTDEVRQFIGNGVVRLIQRAIPDAGPELTQKVVGEFRKYYAENLNVNTRPCPGIPELLDALRNAGIAAACNSNKPDPAVQALCGRHFGSLLALSLGEREGMPKKPAPDGVFHILKTLNASPERTLYVGDGDADILTAKNAGIDCAWVSWGYRRLEELSGLVIPNRFDSASELLRFIL